MPLAALLLLLPPVLLAVAAGLAWCLCRSAPHTGRPIAAASCWLSLGLLAVVWFAAGRPAQDLTAPFPVAGVSLVLSLDSLTVLLWLVVLTSVALLLTFQRWTGEQAALAALAAASALATLAAGSVAVTAFGLAVSGSLVLVLLCEEEVRATPAYWASLTGAWLLLAWTAVLLQVTTGTSVYSAVPVTALHVPVLALLAAAATLSSGLLPWRTWVSDAWSRRRLEAGTLAVALLVPVGYLPVVRAYGLGAGQLPGPQLSIVLVLLGAVTALGAAVRAQAATSRRGLLAESVPLSGGMVLLAIGLGTPLGMVAGLACLGALGVAAGLAPLAVSGQRRLAALALAALLGVPPTLAFGSWLLALQAALEAGMATGFLALVAAAAWLLAFAAAARWARLPVAPTGAELAGSRQGVLVGVAFALAGGVGLTALLALLTIPAVNEVMPPTGRLLRPAVSLSDVLGGGSLTVATASGGWASALLGGPLVALGLGAALAWRLGWGAVAGASTETRSASAPEPLFTPPLAGVPERGLAWVRSARLPNQYRSLLRPALLQRAASGPPWFWIVVTAGLAFVVARS